jgi:hypothetical protein
MTATTLPLPSGGVSAVHRYFEVSLFLLVTVGFAAVAATGRLDLPSHVVMVAALGYKALRYQRHREPELSARTVYLLTVLYMPFFLFDLILLSGGLPDGLIPAATHLVLFVAVMKIFSARSNRDYLWLALIGFLEILAAAVLTVDTTFLVFFFFFMIAGISTFVSFEIKRNTERTRTAPLAPGSPLGRRLERSLVATSVSIAVSTLALSVFFFFLLPRVSTGYLGAYGAQAQPISGFTDEVTLGDIGSIKTNPAVVMRVQSLSSDPHAIEGLRWRGIALAGFDGHKWYSHFPERRALRATLDGTVGLPIDPYREPTTFLGLPQRRLRYRVLLEPISTNTLFAASVPRGLRGRFQWIAQDEMGTLYDPRPEWAKTSYEALSDVAPVPLELLRRTPAEYPANVRALYLQFPEPMDPRVAALARQMTAGADNAYDKAAALENFLKTRFGYTLELPATPEDDPIASFLFERRQGHCEYFAAAMAVMLRTQGIPSRLVNGFLTGEYNEVSGNYIVRASHAHTWVEVFFPSVGWVEFDPTPPDPNVPEHTWQTTLGHYYDAFDLYWDEWVVNYDLSHQARLAQGARRTLAWLWQSRYWVRRQRMNASRWLADGTKELMDNPRTLPVALALAAGVVLLWRGRALRDWWRAYQLLRRANGGAALGAAEATLLYRRLLAQLRRRGFAKPAGATPLEFAAGLPPPELAATVVEFTHLYNRARFGEAGIEAARLLALLQQAQEWRPQAAPRDTARV